MKTITKKLVNKRTGEVIEYKTQVPAKEQTSKQQFGLIGGALLRPLETGRQMIPEQYRPPSLEEATGVSKMVQEKAPVVGKTQEELQQLAGRAMVSGANVAGLGIPKMSAAQAGIDILPSGRLKETAADIIGGVGGGILGAPGAIYRGVSGLKGLSMLPSFLREGVAGAVTGAAYTPDKPLDLSKEGLIQQVKERGKQAAIGGASAVILNTAARGMRDMWRQTKGSKIKFFEKIRENAFQSKRDAINRFGQAIEDLSVKNPNKTIDLIDIVDDFRTLAKEDASIASLIRRTPALKSIMENPKGVTLKQTQDIINGLKSKIPIAKLTGKNIRPDDLNRLELIGRMQEAQVEAFPEMRGVRKDYAKVAEPFRQVRKYLAEGDMERGLRTGFGKDVEFEVKQLPNILPKSLISQLGGYRNAHGLLVALSKLAPAAIGVGAGGYYLRRQLSNLLPVGESTMTEGGQ